jgi:hypothetical protein
MIWGFVANEDLNSVHLGWDLSFWVSNKLLGGVHFIGF